MVSRKPDDVRAQVKPKSEERTKGNAKTYTKGIGKGSINQKPEWRTIRTYTKEQRWATGKGWGPGGKGCIVPKKKSQWITQKEYDRIQGVSDESGAELVEGILGWQRYVRNYELPPGPPVSQNFDWRGFLAKCTHPIIWKYLQRESNDLIDFSKDKLCNVHAGIFEDVMSADRDAKQKHAYLLDTMRDYDSLPVAERRLSPMLPERFENLMVSIHESMAKSRFNIEQVTKTLEQEIVHCIREMDSRKSGERFDFIASEKFVGTMFGFQFKNGNRGFGYYGTQNFSTELDVGDVNEDDIKIVMAQVPGCTRTDAVLALKAGDKDVIQAVILLQK